jgi:hypothetical protein
MAFVQRRQMASRWPPAQIGISVRFETSVHIDWPTLK